MQRLFRSFSFRLALIYAALFMVSIGLLLAAGYWFRVELPLETMGQRVREEAAAHAALVRRSGTAETARRLEARARAPDKNKAFHALVSPGGQVLTANLPSWSKPADDLVLIEADRFVDGAEIDHMALVSDQVLADGTRLLIGRDVEEAIEERSQLETAALWIVCSTILLGLTGGWLMSIAIGKRLDSVTTAARQVMNGDLSGRIAVRGSSDDFDRLGETLNLMLERIETLFGAVQRISDHVAHELRTPLARLVGKLETIERNAAGGVDLQLAIEDASLEASRLQQIFSALLRISRIEGGRHVLRRQKVDVVLMLEDLVELYQPEAEQLGIDLAIEAKRPLVAEFDVDLVFQALCNLVDNGLKHTRRGCRLKIIAHRRRQLEFVVADDGPGLPDADIARVAEPFYRGDASQTVAGDGLGLSMVAAIAHAHGAALTLQNTSPGLQVTLAFPPD